MPGTTTGAGRGGELRRQRARARALALRGAGELRRSAICPPDAEGLAWLSKHQRGKGKVLRGVNTGVAGTILSLTQLVAVSGSAEFAGLLRSAACYLAAAPAYAGDAHPGLYVGEGGVAVALLRAGQVLREESLTKHAVAHSRGLAEIPHSSPDLFNGSAGRARCHLLLWEHTRAARDLELAVRAGEALLEAARSDQDGTFWVSPPGYGGLSGRPLLGYAHGAAGIGDALLDLYQATGDHRFRAAASRAADWLLAHKRDIFDDRAGAAWPSEPGGENAPPYWCQGAVGIGRFFLHAARLGEGTHSRDVAAACAVSASRCGAWQGPVLCHGIAGAIEFLVDAGRVLGRDEHLAAAAELAGHIQRFTVEPADGSLAWCSESPVTVTPDYLVGYAGIIACLAKLGAAPRKQDYGIYPSLAARAAASRLATSSRTIGSRWRP